MKTCKRVRIIALAFIMALTCFGALGVVFDKDASALIKDYEGKSQLVTVTFSGKNELKSIKIDSDNLDSDDIEMLEDMILVAVNEAIANMEKDKQEKLGKYGQMFNGLM